MEKNENGTKVLLRVEIAGPNKVNIKSPLGKHQLLQLIGDVIKLLAGQDDKKKEPSKILKPNVRMPNGR